jgi:hypothetical protein
VIVDIGLIYRPLRFLGATAAIALLPALVYGGGLVASYMSTHAIAEGFLYRMVAVAVFSIVGVQCMMLGVIGERVAQLLHGHDRPRSRVGQVIGSAARPAVAAIVAAVLFAVAIFANRYTIVQYVTTRTVQSHWSFVVFGAFLTILACQFASFAVIDYFIRLLRAHRRERERMRKESREHAS